jgi:uncharacterized OsmC-like protein
MTVAARIKEAFERTRHLLSRRPTLRQQRFSTTVRLAEGLACEIESGPWRLVADLPPTAGGGGAGPTPGVLGRAALGSCLAIGYALRAAASGVPIARLEIEVTADSDEGALFGVPGAVPGYSEVRYTVTVESSAPLEEVRRVLDEADAHSPYLAVFERPQRCTRTVVVRRTGET